MSVLLTVETVLSMLCEMGCDDDPITVAGVKTTVSEFSDRSGSFFNEADANVVFASYHREGESVAVAGSFRDMLRDRLS